MGAALDESEFGRVTWHCSEEDSGPDVGLSLGLGDGRILWVGEISNSAHEEISGAAALGNHFGWWLIAYTPECEVLGKFVNAEAARTFIDSLAEAMNGVRR